MASQSARGAFNEFLKCFERTNQQLLNCAQELLSIFLFSEVN